MANLRLAGPALLCLAAAAAGAASSASGCGTDVNLGPSGGCAADQTRCGDVCVALDANPEHCGACGVGCSTGLCSNGVCQACEPPLVACAEGCVDVSADTKNCGGCGAVCPEGSYCAASACVCPGTVCADVCVDTSSDPANCGGCLIACAPGDFCVGGGCRSVCPPELVVCGDVCVDVLFDLQHCGDCFNPCPPGDICDFGGCIPQCSGGPWCGACDVLDASSSPQSFGSTFGGSDLLAGSCGGFGSPEAVFWFQAPVSGTYVFDTVGTVFDSVLYVLDPFSCGELACNDGWSNPPSQVLLTLGVGEEVLLVVDGVGAGDQGDYVLQWYLTDCPMTDLGSMVPLSVMGSTQGGFSNLESACAFTVSPEATYLFTAPADGSYTFDTAGSGFDTVLYLLDSTCGGIELACNDDAAPVDVTSAVTIDLFADQQVVVVVDGYGIGSFVLNVQ
jgi:hypothetical protein